MPQTDICPAHCCSLVGMFIVPRAHGGAARLPVERLIVPTAQISHAAAAAAVRQTHSVFSGPWVSVEITIEGGEKKERDKVEVLFKELCW